MHEISECFLKPEFCSSLNIVCIAILETEHINTDYFTMPLKLCSIFINMENKINQLQQFCLTASTIWKAFQCKDYKTNIKSIYLLLA